MSRTVGEKLPAVIFGQPDSGALRIFEHCQRLICVLIATSALISGSLGEGRELGVEGKPCELANEAFCLEVL
jgi:hypothetical protein